MVAEKGKELSKHNRHFIIHQITDDFQRSVGVEALQERGVSPPVNAQITKNSHENRELAKLTKSQPKNQLTPRRSCAKFVIHIQKKASLPDWGIRSVFSVVKKGIF